MNLPNYTYRPITVGSLFTAHNSQAANYAFASKERDTETGLSYFGARYYYSDLSIWLSVDPMVDKYPSFSPYVYCANNPIKLVDPNGEEIGNFFDAYGKYLGTDGQKDNNVYIVTDSKSQKLIRTNDRRGTITELSKVNVALSTNTDVLQETYNVYQRTEGNGGNREEASTFDNNGNLTRYPTGSKTIDIAKEGAVSIHSHLLNLITGDDGSKDNIQTPSNLSQEDKDSFNGYYLNIVVGKSNCDSEALGCVREQQAVFYNSKSQEILLMDLKSVHKIINHKQ